MRCPTGVGCSRIRRDEIAYSRPAVRVDSWQSVWLSGATACARDYGILYWYGWVVGRALWFVGAEADQRLSMDYPARYESQFSLDDGTPVYVRPIRATDVDHMMKLFEKFSPETVYFRFFSAMKSMPIDKLREFCDIDYDTQMALVAYVMEDGEESLVGVARYVVTPEEGGAEFAVVVADEWQNRKIGTNLFQRLVEAAKDRRIETFHGLVMNENIKALGIIRNSGYKYQKSVLEPGIAQVEFKLSDIKPSQAR